MTMKQIAPFLLVAALSACGQSETPKQAANVPTVEELAADLDFSFSTRRRALTPAAFLLVSPLHDTMLFASPCCR